MADSSVTVEYIKETDCHEVKHRCCYLLTISAGCCVRLHTNDVIPPKNNIILKARHHLLSLSECHFLIINLCNTYNKHLYE